ncbi:MAG: tetratricopeptide repeat protein [Promethearchaeota archaeon]
MLKVFLSSTYRDLADYRTEILNKLNLTFEGAGMEQFIPDGSKSQEICIGNLKENDVVIFLISSYYGSLMDTCSLKNECKAECLMKSGKGKISYTHCEYKTTKAERILHQTYLVGKGWDASDVKKEALQFREEIGEEYLGFVDIEDPEFVQKICYNLASKIIEWHTNDQLNFTQFVDREKELNEIINNIDSKIEVWGVGGVGKTALIEVALLIQKLKGKKILTVGIPKMYVFGSGYEDFRDKCEENQYITDSREQITIIDIIKAFAKIDLIIKKKTEEIFKMPSDKQISYLSTIIRREKNLILFIDDFHLATDGVVDLAKSVDHLILSSRKNSYIAKDIYLGGINKKDRDDLINLFSATQEKPPPENVKKLIADFAEGHPVSTEILVKNYQRISNFNKFKDFNLENANQRQVNDFFRRVIKEIFSTNKTALKLLEAISVINTELEFNINRTIVEQSYSYEHVKEDFNELIDTGMLNKKKDSEIAYEFYFKHIQDALEDEAQEENHDFAIRYYEKKRELLKEEYSINDEVEVLFHKVQIAPEESLVALFLEVSKKTHPVHDGFRRLIDIGGELLSSLDGYEKSVIQNILGVKYVDLGRFEEAESVYTKALATRKELAATNPDVYLSDVAGTQINLGNLYSDLGRFVEAESAYTEALATYKELAASNPDAYLPDVAITQNNLAILLKDLLRNEEAEIVLTESLAIFKKLITKNDDYLPDMANIQNTLGMLCSKQRRFKDAEIAYTNALTTYKELAATYPDVYLPYVANLKNNLGSTYLDLKQFDRAEINLSNALEMYKDLSSKNSDVYLPYVVNTLNNLGILYQNLNQFEKAEIILTDALVEYKKLIAMSSFPDANLPRVVNTHNNLGTLYINLKKFEEAAEVYADALAIYKDLADSNPDLYLPKLAFSYNQIGGLFINLKRLDDADKNLNEALKIYVPLMEKYSEMYSSNFAEMCYNKARLEAVRDCKEKAIENLKKAIDLDKMYRSYAINEEDFDNIRDLLEFKDLIEET